MTTCLCIQSLTHDVIKAMAGIVVIIVIASLLYWKRNPIMSWLNKEKTPIWFIVVMTSYAIPVGVLIAIFPTFGALVWENLGIHIDPSWIIIEGLKWSAFLDVVLFIWAYLSWKFDYFFPTLRRRFKKE